MIWPFIFLLKVVAMANRSNCMPQVSHVVRLNILFSGEDLDRQGLCRKRDSGSSRAHIYTLLTELKASQLIAKHIELR
jgi:hypothetical protein